jgi:hypothetical protein
MLGTVNYEERNVGKIKLGKMKQLKNPAKILRLYENTFPSVRSFTSKPNARLLEDCPAVQHL